MVKKLFNLGMQTYGTSLILGVLPSNAVSSNIQTGLANFSGVFPAVGKLAGTGLVLKYGKKLIKKTKLY